MTLLARQKEAQEAAWDRFQRRYPRQAAKMRGKIARTRQDVKAADLQKWIDVPEHEGFKDKGLIKTECRP